MHMLDIPTAANLGGHVGPARGREGPPEGGSGRRREGRVRQEEGSTGGRGKPAMLEVGSGGGFACGWRGKQPKQLFACPRLSP